MFMELCGGVMSLLRNRVWLRGVVNGGFILVIRVGTVVIDM